MELNAFKLEVKSGMDTLIISFEWWITNDSTKIQFRNFLDGKSARDNNWQLRIYIFYSYIGMWQRKFRMHLSYLFCSINYVDRNLIKAFHTEWHIPYFKIRSKQLNFHYNWKIRNKNNLILPFFFFLITRIEKYSFFNSLIELNLNYNFNPTV